MPTRRPKFFNPPLNPTTPEEHEACTKVLGNVICRAYEGFFCTRVMNHPGDHIGGANGVVLNRWHNTEG